MMNRYFDVALHTIDEQPEVQLLKHFYRRCPDIRVNRPEFRYEIVRYDDEV